MYMSFLCVFITPNNLYSEPLTIDLKVALLCEEQVGRGFLFPFQDFIQIWQIINLNDIVLCLHY